MERKKDRDKNQVRKGNDQRAVPVEPEASFSDDDDFVVVQQPKKAAKPATTKPIPDIQRQRATIEETSEDEADTRSPSSATAPLSTTSTKASIDSSEWELLRELGASAIHASEDPFSQLELSDGVTPEEVLAIGELVHPSAKKALHNVFVQSKKAKTAFNDSFSSALDWEYKRRCKQLLKAVYDSDEDDNDDEATNCDEERRTLDDKISKFRLRTTALIEAAMRDTRDSNSYVRGLSPLTVLRAGQSLAMILLFEEFEGKELELNRTWTDAELSDFIARFSAFLFDGYELRRGTNRRHKKNNRNQLEPVSVISITVRAVVALRIIKVVAPRSNIKRLISQELLIQGRTMMAEQGASKPLHKVALLLQDMDHICARLSRTTPADIQQLLMLQFDVATGLRPMSLFKSEGKKSTCDGLLVKDVTIRHGLVPDTFDVHLFVRKEKPIKDTLNMRPMLIEQRNSLFCCVNLLIIHLGSLGYFKLPFAEAVRQRNFDLDVEKFGDRPIFCQLSWKNGKGNLVPTEVMTSHNAELWNKVYIAAMIPRSLCGFRSARKGQATGMCLCFIKQNFNWTKEQLIAKLISHGNWKSKEAAKYVELFATAHCSGIVGQLELHDQKERAEHIVNNYPFVMGVQYDFLNPNSLPEEVKEQMLAGDNKFAALKTKRRAACDKVSTCTDPEKLAELRKKRDKLACAEHQYKSQFVFEQCDVLNVRRFNAALNQNRVVKLPKLAENDQVVDLAKAADVAARYSYHRMALIGYGPHRYLSDVPVDGVVCWSCTEKFTTAADFDCHFADNHENDPTSKLACRACPKAKNFTRAKLVKHFRDRHRIKKHCTTCGLRFSQLGAPQHVKSKVGKGHVVALLEQRDEDDDLLMDRLPSKPSISLSHSLCHLCTDLRNDGPCLADHPRLIAMSQSRDVMTSLCMEDGIEEDQVTVMVLQERLKKFACALLGKTDCEIASGRKSLPQCVLDKINQAFNPL